jgi:hypothetical protein
MGKSCHESILLIHRELLSDAKQLLRFAVDGISRGFLGRKILGKIKSVNYRMMMNLNRPFVVATNRFKPEYKLLERATRCE